MDLGKLFGSLSHWLLSNSYVNVVFSEGLFTNKHPSYKQVSTCQNRKRKSDRMVINNGVPQDSTFGLLFFGIFTNTPCKANATGIIMQMIIPLDVPIEILLFWKNILPSPLKQLFGDSDQTTFKPIHHNCKQQLSRNWVLAMSPSL